MRPFVLPLACALVLGACSGGPPAQEAEPPDTMMAVALAAYDLTMFDSIAWDTSREAIERGTVVYNTSCAKCHGEQGRGDAGLVRRGDTLLPPSFREPDWLYAEDKVGLREQIFVGTAENMPHWGLEGLRPRDVDAVAIFILQSMR